MRRGGPQPAAAGSQGRRHQRPRTARRQAGCLRLRRRRGRRPRPRGTRWTPSRRYRPPRARPTAVVARTHKGHPISFMQDNVAWHHKVPSADQVAQALERAGGIVTTTATAPLAAEHDCRDAWVAALTDLAAADDRIVAVVNDSVGSSQARTVPGEVPRPARQRGHRRAGHGRRRRRLGQRRQDPVRVRGRMLPDRASDGADQGRRGLLASSPGPGGTEPGHGVRRARPDPPLDRGPRVAADASPT